MKEIKAGAGHYLTQSAGVTDEEKEEYEKTIDYGNEKD